MKETSDSETLGVVIERMSKDLANLRARKARVDKGKKRPSYKSDLPPKYRSYKARANKKGISFDLTVEHFEFICSKDCVYCGASSRIGIDRIYSGDGYTMDNVQPCCGTCNMMKFTMSHEDFLRHVSKVYNKCLVRK